MFLAKWFIYFIIYSFVGYIAEVVMVSFEHKKLVNRGFLCGPICPIYGCGALLMIMFLRRYVHDYLALFIIGALIASILEYLISFLLEKIFHNKWWDYSKEKFNLNGRVCLSNTIWFGLGSVGLLEFIHPFASKYLLRLSPNWIVIIAIVLAVLLLADTIYSCVVAYNLRNRIIIVEELKNEKLSSIPSILERKLKKRVANLKMYPSRLMKAFPYLASRYKREFSLMKRLKQKSRKKKEKKVAKAKEKKK